LDHIRLPTPYIRMFSADGTYTGRRYYTSHSDQESPSLNGSSQSEETTSHSLSEGTPPSLTEDVSFTDSSTSHSLTEDVSLTDTSISHSLIKDVSLLDSSTSHSLREDVSLTDTSISHSLIDDVSLLDSSTSHSLREDVSLIDSSMSHSLTEDVSLTDTSISHSLKDGSTPGEDENVQVSVVGSPEDISSEGNTEILSSAAAKQISKVIGTPQSLSEFDNGQYRPSTTEKHNYNKTLAAVHTLVLCTKYKLKEVRAFETGYNKTHNTYPSQSTEGYSELLKKLDYAKRILCIWDRFELP